MTGRMLYPRWRAQAAADRLAHSLAAVCTIMPTVGLVTPPTVWVATPSTGDLMVHSAVITVLGRPRLGPFNEDINESQVAWALAGLVTDRVIAWAERPPERAGTGQAMYLVQDVRTGVPLCILDAAWTYKKPNDAP